MLIPALQVKKHLIRETPPGADAEGVGKVIAARDAVASPILRFARSITALA